jgi:hypothetical protein
VVLKALKRSPGLKALAEKNWILAKSSQKASAPKMTPKPRGSIGQKGYSLIEHMRLDPNSEDDKDLYNNILVSLQDHLLPKPT